MRPVIIFDETDKDHRALLFEFLKTGTWATSPVRFAHRDGSSEQLPAMVGDLAMYYARREFKAI
jgi:hypothetical protein